MIADPRVEMWMPDGWWAGRAEDVTAEGGFSERLRAVLVGSGPVARAFRIPPDLPSERLAHLARDYRLIRIRPSGEPTGGNCPGDLSWVWQATTLALLPLALRRRHRR